MRLHVVKFLTTLVTILMLASHIAFGVNFFTPHIQNYGAYKEVNLLYNEKLHQLMGHVPRDIHDSTRLAPMDSQEILKLSIVLPLNNEEELDNRLMELTNPNSHHYQHFLSHADYVDRYAPTVDQVDAARSYFENNGMIVESVDVNRLIMHVTGTVESINTVFNTEIYYFADSAGDRYYAPIYELQVDQSLAIQSVQGLENRIHAHPNFKVLNKPLTANTASPNARQGLTPSAIKSAYSLSSSLDGTGQILALFELDGFSESDITAYENAFNLRHVPLQTVLVDGANGAPGDGAAEVVLDIELMIALAPGVSKIIVYEGPNTAAGLLDTYNKIATDNLAKSVSSSWGLSETSSTGSLIRAESLIFKQMAAQGQSLFAASGDSGAYDDGRNLSVDDPAAQPLVVAVGGTRLSVNTNGTYRSETTWSSGNGAGQSGGGGGISSIWSIPTWQQGVISSASLGSTTMRNVPDVALDADPNTGYAIYFDGQWTVFGGTSCAAPLWAAFTALVNQGRANNGQSVVGFPSPIIYQLGQSPNYSSSFHDISDNSTNGHYPAVSAFDLATGWGSFYGDHLISVLAGTVTPPPPPPPTCIHANPTLAISPTSGHSQAGGALVYTVSVINNDTTNCGTSSFSLSTTLPNGFTGSFGQGLLSIQPGQSSSTSLTATSSSTTPSGSYALSVNATNSQATSFRGSASATYMVDNTQVPAVNMTITPQNSNYGYNSHNFAILQIKLMSGQTGIPNQPLTLRIQGPSTWTTTAHTDANGVYQAYLFLDYHFPVGQYQITALTNYQGNAVSAHATMTIH